MIGRRHGLAAATRESGIEIEPVTPADGIRAAERDWPHRDPFDRIVAASALGRDLVLLREDGAFRALPGLRRVW